MQGSGGAARRLAQGEDRARGQGAAGEVAVERLAGLATTTSLLGAGERVGEGQGEGTECRNGPREQRHRATSFGVAGGWGRLRPGAGSFMGSHSDRGRTRRRNSARAIATAFHAGPRERRWAT